MCGGGTGPADCGARAVDSRRPGPERRSPPGRQEGARRHHVHVRAQCALRNHPTLGQWLRQLPSGRLVGDKDEDRRRSSG